MLKLLTIFHNINISFFKRTKRTTFNFFQKIFLAPFLLHLQLFSFYVLSVSSFFRLCIYILLSVLLVCYQFLLSILQFLLLNLKVHLSSLLIYFYISLICLSAFCSVYLYILQLQNSS